MYEQSTKAEYTEIIMENHAGDDLDTRIALRAKLETINDCDKLERLARASAYEGVRAPIL